MGPSEPMRRRLAVAIGATLVLGLIAGRLVPPPVIVLSLPFFYILIRKPVLRRLAMGHIIRRPRETALVLLGSLLGTAIITGSFIVSDTLNASIMQGVHTSLGPIDAITPVNGAAYEPVEQALAPLEGNQIDGLLRMRTARVTVATPAGVDSVAEPAGTLVEVNFEDAARFGGDPEPTGIEGATPGPGQAVIGEDLAETLDVGIGDTVRVFAYGAERALEVTGVLDQRGIAGVQLGATSGSSSPTIFVEPGFAPALAAAAPNRGEPPSEFVAVSAMGDVSVETTVAFDRALNAALKGAGLDTEIVPVKRNLRNAAEDVGSSFFQIFFMIGMFSVIAGVLLLVNIFVMLAQERMSELGMLRAVGLRRIGLVGSFSLEGWMYALGSAGLGTLAGIGVGRVIVIVAAGLFAGGGPAGQGSLDLVFTATRSSSSQGFLIGFVISLITVLGSSIRISRLNVIRAIRELPEPSVTKRRLISAVLGAVGVVVGLMVTSGGVRNERGLSVLIGPCIAAVGAVPLLTRVLPRRGVVTVASASTLAWAVFAFAAFGRAFREAGVAVFLVQGVVLVGSAIALLSQNQELIGHGIRAVGGGAQRMALRLGLAYPLARSFRTSMTLAMYALVVYVLATITIFSSIFGSQIDSFTTSVSGGFDLVAESNATNPIPLEEIKAVEGVETVAPIASAFGEWTPVEAARGQEPGATGATGWLAASFDESFIANRAPELDRRPAEYATDADAYRAVLANPDLFIPTGFFLQQGGGPPTAPKIGDKYLLRDPLSGGTRTLTVAAVATAGFGNIRPLMSPAALESVFGVRAQPNVFYVNAAEGVDPDRLSSQLNARFLANGADANSFATVVQERLSQQQGFFKLMRGYLALGLVVGIAGLGVVMVRAVRERRREIGVLRSLGFDPGAVRRAFLVESSFVAMEGILTGTFLAVITTWRLSGNGEFGQTMLYRVPWTSLLLLVVATIVASVIATAAPAQQASRIRPAVALRIAD